MRQGRLVLAMVVVMQVAAAKDEEVAIEARFGGCDATGWCRFWFERPGDAGAALYRVLPDGVTPRARDDALRDRLNALLADMIHQHKRIQLHRLRARQDGSLAATVTVTGIPLTEDEMLRRLQSPDAKP